eukprot:TRINITY_DN9684_c0_g1_i6.p2 TRINITY_DN9684_c0_g1~~TRINITY_DN9684_c0_g1_i6.p2  ORF type:complete len:116 (-),score=29.03 TRINITY_DN9684_c0_g1_i6:661-1008(-)
MWIFFFFQAEDGIRDLVRSRGLGDVYKRQVSTQSTGEREHHCCTDRGLMDDPAAVFAQIDQDGNGSITPQELSCRLSDLGFEEDEIMELFTTLDADADGVHVDSEHCSGACRGDL